MTEQKLYEALTTFDSKYYGYELSSDETEMCAEALGKQIAMKPTLWGDGYADGNIVLDMYDCPNCGKTYEVDYEKHDYCPSCGQRLDWSEV